jgi:3-deoxy-manno-octulosonate cytidylyltransferase (CMP-KDO synthetase)
MGMLGIIPARFASTRFPGKPLADIGGRSMILRVYEQALGAGVFEEVLVATDDRRIFNHVQSAGYYAIMTSEAHLSGTDRCLEALETREREQGRHYEHIINIQGDEPFIQPGQIQKVASLLISGDTQIATLAKLITRREEIFDPNVVKVVFNQAKQALYFSRSPIPFLREISDTQWQGEKAHFKHIGIYGFSSAALRLICKLPQGVLEKHESLEQLRWLENGFQIKLDLTSLDSISIDTPEDLLKITNTH